MVGLTPFSSGFNLEVEDIKIEIKIETEMAAKRVLVCSAWPYASGVPHLGNLIGCLLSGCAFTRYYRLRGADVLHVSGSDAHGTHVEYEAERGGLSPRELSDRVHREILKIIEAYDIAIDNYTTTESPVHYRFVREIYRQMASNGFILSREEERAFCTHCKRFLADRFIEGRCPHCGYEEARGNQCEGCGKLLEPEQLIAPKCNFCGRRRIAKRLTKHWYLDLAKLEPELRRYVASRDFHPRAQQLTLGMLDQGLQPRAVTRDLEWGIPAPFEGAQDKVIYVWAEAALGYVSATVEHFERQGAPERWRDFWFGEEVKQVYTHAVDNVPFHTLIFPGQLLASRQGYHLPDQVAVIRWLNWIGGQAFSKSRGVGLYADDALRLLDAVYWRFYLFYFRPEKRDAEFSWADLGRAINDVFINNIANLFNRVLNVAHKHHGGRAPQAEPDPAILEEIRSAQADVQDTIEAGFLAPALRRICELSAAGNAFFQRERPWEGGNPEAVAGALQVVKAVAILLEPFVPQFCQAAYRQLNLESPTWEDIATYVPGHPLGPTGALLEKIDPQELEARYRHLRLKSAGGTPG